MNVQGKAYLLYDDQCGFCNKSMMFLAGRDNESKIEFLSSHSDFGKALMANNDILDVSNDTVIFIRDGYAYYRSTAVIKALEEIGGMWSRSRLLLEIPICWRDNLYNLIAWNRILFFRSSGACGIQNKFEVKSE
jgi:predicted DCC family thiol-disulfide oxidoreductase YuxK